MDFVVKTLNELARQHTVVTYELKRAQDVNTQRGAAVETDYIIKLRAKAAALNDACIGLAKLIDLSND